MRIITGTLKGRRILPVSGNTTRSTTDRVREAWVSTLSSLRETQDFESLRVLDVFAGSGALGLELLSRDAEFCLFIEQNRKALKVLKANITALDINEDRVSVCHADSLSSHLTDCLRKQLSFDIIVLDPPYNMKTDQLNLLLTRLRKANLLAPGAIISYEHAAVTTTDDQYTLALSTVGEDNSAYIKRLRSKTYGSIAIDYYCYIQDGSHGETIERA